MFHLQKKPPTFFKQGPPYDFYSKGKFLRNRVHPSISKKVTFYKIWPTLVFILWKRQLLCIILWYFKKPKSCQIWAKLQIVFYRNWQVKNHWRKIIVDLSYKKKELHFGRSLKPINRETWVFLFSAVVFQNNALKPAVV